jgi:hypothetical protein
MNWPQALSAFSACALVAVFVVKCADTTLGARRETEETERSIGQACVTSGQ